MYAVKCFIKFILLKTPQNFEILKRITGLEVGSQWFLHDVSFKEFFDWFGQSVDEDNLISDSLLRE